MMKLKQARLYVMLCALILTGWAIPVGAKDMLSKPDDEVVLQDMHYYNPVRAVSLQDYGSADGQPLIRVSFLNPVSKAFVADSIYIRSRGDAPQDVTFNVKSETVPETVKAMLKARGLDQPSRDSKVWLLEPQAALPADTLFSVKIRNTSPPSRHADAENSVQDITLYQFHTEKAERPGYFRKMFDPTSWHGCAEDEDC